MHPLVLWEIIEYLSQIPHTQRHLGIADFNYFTEGESDRRYQLLEQEKVISSSHYAHSFLEDDLSHIIYHRSKVVEGQGMCLDSAGPALR